ncbi:FimD/PapC C-terminal domain-containing protein, partial [Escherichia coli]
SSSTLSAREFALRATRFSLYSVANGSIVAENGQVYLTGLPQSGKLQVSWGNDKNSNCIVDYKLPEVSPGTLLNQQTAICR